MDSKSEERILFIIFIRNRSYFIFNKSSRYVIKVNNYYKKMLMNLLIFILNASMNFVSNFLLHNIKNLKKKFSKLI